MATKRASQNLKDGISEFAEKLTSIHNKAVAAYTPLLVYCTKHIKKFHRYETNAR